MKGSERDSRESMVSDLQNLIVDRNRHAVSEAKVAADPKFPRIYEIDVQHEPCLPIVKGHTALGSRDSKGILFV